LVDDGSTDDTLKIAETFRDKFDLRILNQNHS
jgi:glycosyltransferase involved in cell wall biosynthesis